MKKRMDWLDLAKGVGIILIMIGHAFSIIPKNHLFRIIIYGFHVPLFFFLAGITFKKKSGLSFEQLLKGLLKNLMIPYISCTLLICLFNVFWTRFDGGMAPFFNNINAFFIQIRTSALWFIPVLFISEIICWMIFQFFNTRFLRSFAITIIYLGGIIYVQNWNIPLFWNIDVVPFACVYIYLGMELFQKDILSKQSSGHHFILFLILTCISFASAYSNYFSQPNNMFLDIGMYESYYHIYFLFLISSLSGIYSVIHFSMLIGSLPIINKIGRNSFAYFALHQKVSFTIIGALTFLKQFYQTGFLIFDITIYLLLNFLVLFPAQYLVIFLNMKFVASLKCIHTFNNNQA